MNERVHVPTTEPERYTVSIEQGAQTNILRAEALAFLHGRLQTVVCLSHCVPSKARPEGAR
jgi:hypothetical protein